MWPAERWHDGQSQCDVEPCETEKEERYVGRGAVARSSKRRARQTGVWELQEEGKVIQAERTGRE